MRVFTENKSRHQDMTHCKYLSNEVGEKGGEAEGEKKRSIDPTLRQKNQTEPYSKSQPHRHVPCGIYDIKN